MTSYKKKLNATLFGISHINGIVKSQRHVAGFTMNPTEVPPWCHGEFLVDENISMRYVCGWWNKDYIGEKPSFSEDKTINVSPTFMRLMEYVKSTSSGSIYFQIAAIDVYATGELLNLGPY